MSELGPTGRADQVDFCAKCGAPVEIPLGTTAKVAKCPACQAPLTLPDAAPAVHSPTDDDNAYELETPIVHAPVPERPAPLLPPLLPEIETPGAEVFLREPLRPPEPLSPWDIATFPWRRPAIGYWLVLSVGVWLNATVSFYMIRAFQESVGWETILWVFVLAGDMFLTLMVTAYASACALSILQDTANGEAVVENWPDGDWHAWVFSAIMLITTFMVSAVPGYLLGLPLGIAPLLGVLGLIALLPVFWLSSLEADSLIPYSPVILRSLRQQPGLWKTFYLQSLIAIAVWLLPTKILFANAPAIVMLFYAAPVGVALLFVYSRLLGHLANTATLTLKDPEEDEEEAASQGARVAGPKRSDGPE